MFHFDDSFSHGPPKIHVPRGHCPPSWRPCLGVTLDDLLNLKNHLSALQSKLARCFAYLSFYVSYIFKKTASTSKQGDKNNLRNSA